MGRVLSLVIFALSFIGLMAKEFDVTEDVTFRLFTVNNKFDQHNLGFNITNLTSSGFDLNRDTKIITHGFLNNGSGMSCIALRDAYLNYHDVNVIIVDYEKIGNEIISILPSEKIRLVGEYVAEFIDFLLQSGNPASKIHLMGHSLGAHVIAHAARKTTQEKMSRLTALDPALMGESEYRLDADVADFVDVIHTCGGVYGMVEPIGTADFYPNGGTATQPSCDIIGGVTCSHYEAVRFMVRSISDPERYPAFSCDSETDLELGRCDTHEIAYMGIAATPPANGKYYLTTAKED